MTHSRFDPREEPFEVDSAVCPPFASSDHQEVFNGLFLALLARKRVLVLSGATGAGKTSLLQALLEHLQADGGLTLAVTAAPGMAVEDLIVAAGSKLDPGASPRVMGGHDIEQVVEALEGRLEEAGSGVLVVDEAHRLDPGVVRDLVELAQSDTETGRYMQILLSGEPELESALADPGAAEVIRRSGIVCHLRPLDREQTEQFVHDRLRRAGAPAEVQFEPGALDLVDRLAGGLPAVINPLCAQALRVAEGHGQARVAREHVEQAATQLGMDVPEAVEEAPAPPPRVETPQPPPRRTPAAGPAPTPGPARPAQPRSADSRPALRAETPHKRPTNAPRSNGKFRWAAMGATAVLLGAGTGLALSDGRPLDRLYQRFMGTPAPWSDRGAETGAAVALPPTGTPAPAGAAVAVRPVPAVNPPPAEATARPAAPDSGQPAPGPADADAGEQPDASPAPSGSDGTQVAALPPDATPTPPEPAQPAADAARIAELVEQAERYLEARYLTTPAGTNAFEVYRQIVALDPGNTDATRILNRIKDTYLNWGATAEAQGDLESARRYYERGLTVDPDDPALRIRMEGLARRQENPAPPAEPTDIESAQDYPELAPEQVLRLPPDYQGPPEPPAATAEPVRTAQPNAFDSHEAVLTAIADPQVLEAVIRAGRDVNRELPDGKTPLILAAERGNSDAVYRLLRAGAAPNARSQTGGTALIAAASNGDQATVRALLQYGGAVNAMDVQGRTPLMAAAERGNLDTVRLLLDHGANINATTTRGNSAYDLAVNSGHAHVATLLRLRGAQASGSSSTPIDLRTFRIN